VDLVVLCSVDFMEFWTGNQSIRTYPSRFSEIWFGFLRIFMLEISGKRSLRGTCHDSSKEQ
jgi:hypothetical protein